MRRSIFPVAFLALALGACSPVTPATPTATPAGSSSGTPSASPSATGPAVTGTPVTCNELSFVVDPTLASSVTCETVPAETYEFAPYPEHTRVTLQGYPIIASFHEATISVYPVADYAPLMAWAFPALPNELAALAAGGPAPVLAAPFDPVLPYLPFDEATQPFFAHYSTISFGSGDGIKFLTERGQYQVPVNNTDLFYTFQGLTSDGQYWVSAILPVNHATLPVDADSALGGLTWEDWAATYDAYLPVAVGDLEAQPSASFMPSLDALDALVASIVIAP